MNAMTNVSTARRRRAGFTLIELMIVVSLLAIIGTMVTTVLVRQQRFHRAVATVTDARARMRDLATIMPTDMRGVSSAAGDILFISDTAMQFRAFIGTSIVCKYTTTDLANPTKIDLPPQTLASGNVLTAWINPPAQDDLAYLYDDGTEEGNVDDEWVRATISGVTNDDDPTMCPTSTTPAYTTSSDDKAVRYRITLSSGLNQARIKVGAPIRFAREVRYNLYEAADGQWYVGFATCVPDGNPATPSTNCGDPEVLAGPVLPANAGDLSKSGIAFTYYDRNDNVITAVPSTEPIARIVVKVRTTAESMLKAGTSMGGSTVGGDSLTFSIGLRNRR
jgi:prepilin-type N-terminal cleavage/methylation domain-containing protein